METPRLLTLQGMFSKPLPPHILFLYLEESKGGAGRREDIGEGGRQERGAALNQSILGLPEHLPAPVYLAEMRVSTVAPSAGAAYYPGCQAGLVTFFPPGSLLF